ncbi:MAG TPA: SGNH/GDSL hydrolase family protein [Acidimicrobiales bacterium]|nr:SGNH/GDSL hydrolase family protein [Acidimicrobiales bacterium]
MAALAVATALTLNFSYVAGTTPTTSTITATTQSPKTTVLYVDIGASVSVGVQPTPRAPKGQPTNRGYANRLVTAEAAKGVVLRLTQLGCPGESIASMIHGPDPCYVAPDTQLSDALVFFRAHHLARTLVTIDLGFNTLNVCFNKVDIDLACVNPHLVILGHQLSQVLRVLTHAAGANVSFVGLGHYNPYLTKATKEGAAEVFAGNSVVAMRRMNRTLLQTYRSFNIPMADVAEVFKEEDTTIVHLSKKESTTANVVYECKFTWMCAAKPFGPNIHPTDAGYQAITRAIIAVLPANL